MTPEQLLNLTPSEVDRFVDVANERLLQSTDEWTRHQAVEDLLTFSSMLNIIGNRNKPDYAAMYSRFEFGGADGTTK